jgi:hypothetical protein
MSSETRLEIMRRDGACVAPRLDRDAGECRDGWGTACVIRIDQLEADYVRFGASGRRHELASDHVAVCPGHHRGTGDQGGYVWATSHRHHEREYLASMYP